MDNATEYVVTNSRFTVSPYLTRPLRTRAQAIADIARSKRRGAVVQPFIPVLIVQGNASMESEIAA